MKILSFLEYVATLPCEMFVRKNRHAPEVIEAKTHTTQSLERVTKILSVDVSIVNCSTDERIFTVATSKKIITRRVATLMATT